MQSKAKKCAVNFSSRRGYLTLYTARIFMFGQQRGVILQGTLINCLSTSHHTYIGICVNKAFAFLFTYMGKQRNTMGKPLLQITIITILQSERDMKIKMLYSASCLRQSNLALKNN